MTKGFLKYETNELEWLSIKTAYSSKKLHSALVYIPKKFAGRRVLVAVPAENPKGVEGTDGGEKSE